MRVKLRDRWNDAYRKAWEDGWEAWNYGGVYYGKVWRIRRAYRYFRGKAA